MTTSRVLASCYLIAATLGVRAATANCNLNVTSRDSWQVDSNCVRVTVDASAHRAVVYTTSQVRGAQIAGGAENTPCDLAATGAICVKVCGDIPAASATFVNGSFNPDGGAEKFYGPLEQYYKGDHESVCINTKHWDTTAATIIFAVDYAPSPQSTINGDCKNNAFCLFPDMTISPSSPVQLVVHQNAGFSFSTAKPMAGVNGGSMTNGPATYRGGSVQWGDTNGDAIVPGSNSVAHTYTKVGQFHVLAEAHEAYHWRANDGECDFLCTARQGAEAVVSPRLLQPSGYVDWGIGSQQTVLYDAGEATGACSTVDIRLSNDGGMSYAYALALGAQNTGATAVTVPKAPTHHARLKIECTNTQFSATSTSDFTVFTPLKVTSPSSSVTWSVSGVQTLTWDGSVQQVAPAGCNQVDVLLSLDGGGTFPVVLGLAANSGSTMVNIPNQRTTHGRLKLRCAGNPQFFADGLADITIYSRFGVAQEFSLLEPLANGMGATRYTSGPSGLHRFGERTSVEYRFREGLLGIKSGVTVSDVARRVGLTQPAGGSVVRAADAELLGAQVVLDFHFRRHQGPVDVFAGPSIGYLRFNTEISAGGSSFELVRVHREGLAVGAECGIDIWGPYGDFRLTLGLPSLGVSAFKARLGSGQLELDDRRLMLSAGVAIHF